MGNCVSGQGQGHHGHHHDHFAQMQQQKMENLRNGFESPSSKSEGFHDSDSESTLSSRTVASAVSENTTSGKSKKSTTRRRRNNNNSKKKAAPMLRFIDVNEDDDSSDSDSDISSACNGSMGNSISSILKPDETDPLCNQFRGRLSLMLRFHSWKEIPLDFFVDAHVTVEDVAPRSRKKPIPPPRVIGFAQPA